MCAHILFIFLSPMTGFPLSIGKQRPVLPLTPFVWVNNNIQMEVFLTEDDLFRLSLTLFLFMVVFPFSISNWARNKVIFVLLII